MKIVNQTDSAMVLKEGDASSIVWGAGIVIAGGFVWHYLQASQMIVFGATLVCIIIGLAIVFFSSSITVNANKANGQILYQKKRLIGGSTNSYAIADVLRIETRKQWHTENVSSGSQGRSMPRQVLVSQSIIIFKDGRELPLDHQKSSSSMSVGSGVLMGGSGTQVAIAAQVANFLGVPFQEITPPNNGMGINIGGGRVSL